MQDKARVLIFDGYYSCDIINRGDYIEIRTDGSCTSVYFGKFQLDEDQIVHYPSFDDGRHKRERPVVKKAGAKIGEPIGEEDILIDRIELSYTKESESSLYSSAILRITAVEPCCGSPRYKIVYTCDEPTACSFGMVRRITPEPGEAIVVTHQGGMFPFVRDERECGEMDKGESTAV